MAKQTSFNENANTKRHQQKMTMAKRAIRSLLISLLASISLPITIIVLFGSGQRYRALQSRPIWFAPLWLIHVCTMVSSFLMGLAAWLVWADGGFHAKPDALPIYVAQISLSVTWYPLVLVMGLAHIALGFWTVNFGALVACYVKFGSVNRIAAGIIKPCVIWAGYLLIVTLKLHFL